MTYLSAQKGGRKTGVPWALGMVMGYTVAYLFDRVAINNADPLVGPFLRTLPSLGLGVLLMWKNRTLDQLRSNSPRYIGRRALLSFVWAGVISTVGLFFYYFSLRIGGVVITVPVLSTYLIWGAVFAWPFLGERLNLAAGAGIGVIVAGVVALGIGETRGQTLGALWYWAIPLGAVAAATYGISGVFWRDGQLRGAHQSTAILLQFATSIGTALAGLAVSGRLASLISTSWRDAAALLASGVLSGVVGVYCLFMALRRMSVARVYAFSGLQPLLATLAAHFLLNEYLNSPMLAGIVAISVGVVLAQIFGPGQERQA